MTGLTPRRGRRRAATAAEMRDTATLYRPNAVLSFLGAIPEDATQEEKLLAGFLDGFRPLARVRAKTGMSALTLRHALDLLVERGAVQLVALIEEDAEAPELRGLRDLGATTAHPPTRLGSSEAESSSASSDIAESVGRSFDSGATMPRGEHDIIPPHVMAEIEAMVEEEVRRQNEEREFDDETAMGLDDDDKTSERD